MPPKSFSIDESQKLDRFASGWLGIPSIVLMENAGRSTADFIQLVLKKTKNPRVCIFSGPGNNGGDGFVTARYLWDRGFKVSVFLIAPSRRLKGDALLNYKVLRRMKCPLLNIKSIDSKVMQVMMESDLLVDAIFGIGLDREVSDPYCSIIDRMNQSRKKIVSLDVPSGLNANLGSVWGIGIKAWSTVTFAVAKNGFFKDQGPRLCGKIVIKDIGIPQIVINKIGLKK